jgi:MFS family permease
MRASLRESISSLTEAILLRSNTPARIDQRTSPAKVLVASTIGLAFGLSAVTNASFGVFVLPLSQTFEWKRGDISFAMAIFQIFNIIMAPVAGWFIDRLGIRSVLIPSVIVFGTVLASLSLLSGPLWQLYVGYALLATVGIGTSSVSYARLIVPWFSVKRGFALGTALAGMGVSVSFLPFLVRAVMELSSWRTAYIAEGALVIVAVSPFVMLWAWDPQHPASGVGTNQAEAAPQTSGLEFREAIGSRAFVLLAVGFGFLGILTGAIPSHVVPLLVERGVAPMQATIMASALGLSLIAGRIVMGYFMDRFFAPLLMTITIAIASAGLVMMLIGMTGVWMIVPISCAGFAIGADADFLSYLTSRYIGMRAFTRTLGLLFSAFATGTGIGPAIMGYSANVSGSYNLALEILIATTTIAIIPFLFLGPYPKGI